MKSRFLLALCLLTTPLAAPIAAQPPDPPKPAKPAAPPLSLDEANTLLGGPTRVTMHMVDATPKAIVAELSKQAGVNIRLQVWGGDEARKGPLTIDLENQPFWTALGEVCTKLRVQPQAWGMESGLTLMPSGGDLVRGREIALSPMVTLVLRQFSHTHTLSFTRTGDAVADRHAMPLEGSLLFDPKLRPLAGQTARLHLADGVDENGLSLLGERTGHSYGQTPLLWNLHVPLEWRPHMGKQLKRLVGTVKLFIVARREVWEVPDVTNAKNVSKTIKGPQGDETYTVTEVTKTGNQYQAQMKITRPQIQEIAPGPEATPEAQQLHWARRELGRMARLMDANGREWRYSGGGGGGDTMSLVFTDYSGMPDDKPGPPQKLVIEIPTEFRELTIPLEFKDLPLP